MALLAELAMAAPAIVIAAGGDGERIGGAKPLRLLAGRRLLDHAIAMATAQSDCCAIAAREVAQIGSVALPVLHDAWPGAGPINALASAFRFAADQGRRHVLLIGCDQPFLPRDLAQRLGAAIGQHTAAIPVSAGRYQPMAALWQADAPALEAYAAQGGRSLWRFAEQRGAVHVPWPAAEAVDPFTNINDPEALAAAERRFRDR